MSSKIYDVYTTLLNLYGPQDWWPVHEGQDRISEIVIGAVLTQNTSWKNVEKALENLIQANCLNFERMVNIPQKELTVLIRPAGFYTRKSQILKDVAKLFLEKEQPTRQQLLSIKGVGKETADSILLYALEKPYFVIDAYTKRLFYRLGFCEEKTSYDGLQKLITENIPEDVKIYKEFHALIVEHCKNVCKKKPNCDRCILRWTCHHFLEVYLVS